jgi:PAS domain S-box-containing protein
MSTSILVVEDEVLIAHDIRRILTGFGYDVLPLVTTGLDALHAADTRPPDLVLMDIKLRGPMDGIEAAAILQEKHHTPVVYLTSHSDETTLTRAKSTSPSGYVIKPFTDRELRTSIEVALSKHELESKLVAKERWFSSTLRSIGDAVIATDEHEAIQFMNGVAETLTGWKSAEAIGRPLGEVVRLVDPDNKPLAGPVTHALRSGFAAMLQNGLELVSKDGSRLHIDDGATLIKDEQGVVLGRVVVFRDITDRVKMEKRLALSERLASVGRMAAEVAHEINNPLAYVTLNVSYVLDELPAVGADGGLSFQLSGAQIGEIRKALQDVAGGCERVRTIVQGLRRFARVEDSVCTLVDLPDVLDAAARMTANAIRHHARLQFAYGTTPFVEASEGQLVQVFTNLLINAYQAIGDGTPSGNEVRIVTFTDEGGRAVVEIHDTGCGIPGESLAGIFEPFFTTKGADEGTGLGLPICQGIVTALGGLITVESALGKGSVFRVVLPPATRGPDAPGRAAARVSGPRRGRVLVVDDDVAVGKAIGRVLGKDHTVVIENDARQALTRMAKENFDVIFSDLMMPGMSGSEFYEAVLKADPASARRIVFMTGGAFSLRSAGFLESVANMAIAKPFDVDSLKSILKDFLT